MKKILLTTAMIAIASLAIAQENVLTNKRGTPILPTAGSWAFGVDATPFLNYAGRLIGNTAANSPEFRQENYGFSGKYFLSDNTAARFGVTLGFSSDKTTTFVPKIGGGADEQVENTARTSGSNIVFSAGLEKRIGQTRLQGFYGAEANLRFSRNNNRKYTYGNALSATNPGIRPLSDKNGLTFGIGAGAFAGVEYFVAPGISLGAQIGWGLGLTTTGRSSVETETWTGTAVETTTTDGTTKGSVFTVGHGAHTGITLMFHF